MSGHRKWSDLKEATVMRRSYPYPLTPDIGRRLPELEVRAWLQFLWWWCGVTREMVDYWLQRWLTEAGQEKWWDRKHPQLDERSPNEVFDEDPERVLAAALCGMEQTGT